MEPPSGLSHRPQGRILPNNRRVMHERLIELEGSEDDLEEGEIIDPREVRQSGTPSHGPNAYACYDRQQPKVTASDTIRNEAKKATQNYKGVVNVAVPAFGISSMSLLASIQTTGSRQDPNTSTTAVQSRKEAAPRPIQPRADFREATSSRPIQPRADSQEAEVSCQQDKSLPVATDNAIPDLSDEVLLDAAQPLLTGRHDQKSTDFAHACLDHGVSVDFRHLAVIAALVKSDILATLRKDVSENFPKAVHKAMQTSGADKACKNDSRYESGGRAPSQSDVRDEPSLAEIKKEACALKTQVAALHLELQELKEQIKDAEHKGQILLVDTTDGSDEPEQRPLGLLTPSGRSSRVMETGVGEDERNLCSVNELLSPAEVRRRQLAEVLQRRRRSLGESKDKT